MFISCLTYLHSFQERGGVCAADLSPQPLRLANADWAQVDSFEYPHWYSACLYKVTTLNWDQHLQKRCNCRYGEIVSFDKLADALIFYSAGFSRSVELSLLGLCKCNAAMASSPQCPCGFTLPCWRAVLCQVDALDDGQQIESREHRNFSVPFELWYSV